MSTALRQRLGFAASSWRALGVEIRVVVTEPDSLGRAREIVEAEVEALDMACSRFRDDSELTRLDSAGGAWTAISPLLTEALTVALAAARQTDGDVDPTLGRAVRALGYDRDFALLPAHDPRPAVLVRRIADWRSVELDAGRRRARIPTGLRLDLGATAKAWGADRAARQVSADIGGGVLVGFGGDIAVAGDLPPGGWPVRVQDRPQPLDQTPDGPAQTIALRSGGLATSSTAARRWRRGGAELHHLLDPRTGLPAVTPWRTVSVAARTCLAANTVTATAIIRGGNGLEFVRASGCAGRLVARTGEVTLVNGWPEQ